MKDKIYKSFRKIILDIANKKYFTWIRCKIITPKEKKLLKERHKIENVFAMINNNHRVMVRRDKNLNNYFSFVYMSMLEIYIKYAYTHNLENRQLFFKII